MLYRILHFFLSKWAMHVVTYPIIFIKVKVIGLYPIQQPGSYWKGPHYCYIVGLTTSPLIGSLLFLWEIHIIDCPGRVVLVTTVTVGNRFHCCKQSLQNEFCCVVQGLWVLMIVI